MKNQCTKIVMIGLIGLVIEGFVSSPSLLAQEIPTPSSEETPVISVENVKPLENHTGTPQDLGEIQGDNNQWTWGVGGEQTISETSEAESVYQIDRKSHKNDPADNGQQINQYWPLNQGDPASQSSKIPFARF